MVDDSLASPADAMCSSQTVVSNAFIYKLNRLTCTNFNVVESTDPVFNVDQAATVIINYLDSVLEVLSELFLSEDIVNVYEQRNSLSDISTCMQETIDHLLLLMNSLDKIKDESEISSSLPWNPLSSNLSTTTKRSPFLQRLRRRSETAINSDFLHSIVAKIETAIAQWNSVSNLILNLIERMPVATEWAELNYIVMGGIETEINACNVMLMDYQKPEEPLHAETPKSLSTKIFHFHTIQNKLKHLQASLNFLHTRLEMFERKALKYYRQAAQDLNQKYYNLIQRRDGLASKIAYASTIFGSGIWLKVLESICLEANQLLVLTEKSFSTGGEQIKELVSCFDVLERASSDNLLPVHLLEQKQDLDSRWNLVKEKLYKAFTVINNTPTKQPIEPFEETKPQSVTSPVVQRFVTSVFCSPFSSTHSPSNSLFSNVTFSPGHSCKTSANSISSSGFLVSSTFKSSSNLKEQERVLNQTEESRNRIKVSRHAVQPLVEGIQQQNEKESQASRLDFDLLQNKNTFPSPMSTNTHFSGDKLSKCRLKNMSVSSTMPFVYESSVEGYASTRLDIKSAPMVAIDACPVFGVNSQSLGSYSSSSASLHTMISEKDYVKSKTLFFKGKHVSTISESPVSALASESDLLQASKVSSPKTTNLVARSHVLSKSETIRPRSPVPTDPPPILNGRPLYFRPSFISRFRVSPSTLIPRALHIGTSCLSKSSSHNARFSNLQSNFKSNAPDILNNLFVVFAKLAPLLLHLALSRHLLDTMARITPVLATNENFANDQPTDEQFSEPVFRKSKILESSCQI